MVKEEVKLQKAVEKQRQQVQIICCSNLRISVVRDNRMVAGKGHKVKLFGFDVFCFPNTGQISVHI